MGEVYVKYLSIVRISEMIITIFKCYKNIEVPMPWEKAHS